MRRNRWTRREVLSRGAGAVALAAAGLALPTRPSTAAPGPDGSGAPGATKAGGSAGRVGGGAENPAGSAGKAGGDRETAELLRELLRQRALGTTNPWLMAHLVLAFGAGLLDHGKPVIDGMVAGGVTRTTIDGKTYPHFDEQIERHPFHFLQILQLADVPYERAFATPAGRYTRRELIAGSEGVFDPSHQGDEDSWTISVLTNELPPARDRFTTARGQKIVVADLVEEHLRDTEEAYAATFASKDEGKPYGRGAIHGKACNGAHLIYGLIDALRCGYTGHDLKARFTRLIDATLFRLELEQRLVDASLRGENPMIRLNADAVKLSFLGHVLEDLGYAIRVGVLTLDAAQLAEVATARRQLGEVVERLISQHDLDELRAKVPNAFSVLLGDACHALRGIEYWT